MTASRPSATATDVHDPSITHTPSLAPIRRVVTGHDDRGHAVVSHDGVPPCVVQLEHIPGTVFYEIWNTGAAPPVIDNGPDPTAGPLVLPPPRNGTRVRIVDIPPDTEDFLKNGAERMHAAFAQIGDASASTVRADSPHPLMHRTESLDYGVLLKGELTLVLDHSEVLLHPGDVVVQRGTNHAWANRSGAPCRMLFVLVDGRYGPSISGHA